MKNKIYQINNGKVEVYSFDVLKDKMEEFRAQELLKIPEDERVLKKDNPLNWFSSRNGVVYSCGAYVLRGVPSSEDETFSVIEERFIRGDFVGDPVRIVERFDDDGEIIYIGPVRDTLENKIQITSDLQLVQLLENEEFQDEMLEEEELAEIGELFDISEEPITSIVLDELIKMYKAELIKGDVDSQVEYLEKSGKVLEKLRN